MKSDLASASSELHGALLRGDLPAPQSSIGDIRCETTWVAMRDGIRLATDLYLPPVQPAPVVIMRTPYGRATDANVGVFVSFARRGYVVVAQDCRGTGLSEPDHWDYYMYEAEDGYDCIEWITRQTWFGGFIGSLGASYVGQTQWCMATHPAMSTIAPTVSGLGIAFNTAHLYMFLNAYARSVGKGADKVAVPYYELERLISDETMAGGYFNEPLQPPFSAALLNEFPQLREMSFPVAQRWLWEHYCTLSGTARAQFVKRALAIDTVTSVAVESLPVIFGHRISHDAHTLPHPNPAELCRRIEAPPLMITGWYDWCLNDALATWTLLRREGRPEIAERARFVIGPNAHNMPGYREGIDYHFELLRIPGVTSQVTLLLSWYEAVRHQRTDAWPTVIYYLMGANEWCVASDWPVPESRQIALYLSAGQSLTREPPRESLSSDQYWYDPTDPTPTVGGSIVSYVYPPGSVDVSAVQQRSDVLVYTTPPLAEDLDVVGPVRMVLYATSSAFDTDFFVRLSDVFPDNRAIQIQSGHLRARYRGEAPELLEPGRVYRLEIDLWATANRFKSGHKLRVDIASADFPHFDRNTNRGGMPQDPVAALQTIYHDAERPSHLLVSVLSP